MSLDGWKLMTLDEAGVEVLDCEHKTPAPAREGVPYVSIPELIDGRVAVKKARLVSLKDAAIWNRRVAPQAGDIVLSRRTNPGVTAVIPPGLPCVLGQNLVILRSRGPDVEQAFLRWIARSPEWWQQVQKHLNVGAVFDSLRCADIPRFELHVPPVREQRAIAGILNALDDKIDLNRRMSETLEAMARALFKSWFVDFEPVRAKAERRDTGLPQELADLFPDRVVQSELGGVPKGWRVSRLGDEVPTVLGGTPSRAEPAYWGGDIPWINSGKANEFRIVKPTEFITRAGLESSATELLPPRTTVIAITGATLGQISLTEFATCANQSIVGVLGTAALPSEFVYFWTKEHVDDLLAWQTGGAQQHINKNNVNALRVLCPAEGIMSAFVHVIRPAFDRIAICCTESCTLTALRDALLPKLMSGELPVEGTDKVIGRAT